MSEFPQLAIASDGGDLFTSVQVPIINLGMFAKNLNEIPRLTGPGDSTQTLEPGTYLVFFVDLSVEPNEVGELPVRCFKTTINGESQ